MPINTRKFGSFGLMLPLCGLLLFQSCTSSKPNNGGTACTTLLCSASMYSLLVADLDGSNVSMIKTSTYQEMTHPRVSNDKNWVMYTGYNDVDSRGCASLSKGYANTEIRAVQMSGAGDKGIIAPVAGEFHSNGYWIGTTNEFTYLAGPPSTVLKFYNRVTVDSLSMDIIAGPTPIPIPADIFAVDPQTNLTTNKIVFSGLYDATLYDPSVVGFVKSIFIMNLSDGGQLERLSLGKNHDGKIIACPVTNPFCEDIMENDPKISPDGTHVAFMRQAPTAGIHGFGWHIFVVPVENPLPVEDPLSETDLSYTDLGSDINKNEGLPEWVDNNTLIFSSIEITSLSDFAKHVYTMKIDGTQKTKIPLPAGFRYSDVFPFTDGNGKQRMILSAEKIGATCTR